MELFLIALLVLLAFTWLIARGRRAPHRSDGTGDVAGGTGDDNCDGSGGDGGGGGD